MAATVSQTHWHSFRCHVLRLHYWRTMSNPDGERYRACAVCSLERSSSFAPLPPG